MWTLVAQERKDFMKVPCKEVMGEGDAHDAVGWAAGTEGVPHHGDFKHCSGKPLIRTLQLKPIGALQQFRTSVPGNRFILKKKKIERNSF